MCRKAHQPGQTDSPNRGTENPDRWTENPFSVLTSRRLMIPALLLLAASLAINSLVGDSLTFDEANHLTAGMSYLETGDFRLAPGTPPLAQMWAAFPLLLMDQHWPSPQTPGWRGGNVWRVARVWLFELNDGERLLFPARCMMVVLLLATCLSTYALARTLFGQRAALLTLTLAALSPTYLAHGRLVTADIPATLCVMVTLLTFARLLQRVTLCRLLGASLPMAAFALTKFSWPLVIPALALMAAVAVLRVAPMQVSLLSGRRRGASENEHPAGRLTSRAQRAGVVALIALCLTATTWFAVWTCFGWRYEPFGRGHLDGTSVVDGIQAEQPGRSTDPASWRAVLSDDAGQPIRGVTIKFIRWARKHRLLPEVYLYGFAYVAREVRQRDAYLCGEYSKTGWRSYFPIAFVIKTPIATMLLFAVGLAAVITRRDCRVHDTVLFNGLVAFVLVYLVAAVTSQYNLGHRHLLPVYPAVMVFAGCSVTWLCSRWGRRLVGSAVAWVLIANLWIHPHYLSYFNELISGPGRGHLYLADSNIDWGQDLKRLAEYARRHHPGPIKLAYFGSGDPTRYGFDCEMLPSFLPFGKPARLTPGVYVVSVTQLLGVYEPRIRDSFWDDPRNLETYRQLYDVVTQSTANGSPGPSKKYANPVWHRLPAGGDVGFNSALHLFQRTAKPSPREWSDAVRAFDDLRRCRLINQLRKRTPDERIGYSLFVYHLSQADIDTLLAPEAK